MKKNKTYVALAWILCSFFIVSALEGLVAINTSPTILRKDMQLKKNFFINAKNIGPRHYGGWIAFDGYNYEDDTYDVHMYIDSVEVDVYTVHPGEYYMSEYWYPVDTGWHTVWIQWYVDSLHSWHRNETTVYVSEGENKNVRLNVYEADGDFNGFIDEYEQELAEMFCPSLLLHSGDQGVSPEPVEIMFKNTQNRWIMWLHAHNPDGEYDGEAPLDLTGIDYSWYNSETFNDDPYRCDPSCDVYNNYFCTPHFDYGPTIECHEKLSGEYYDRPDGWYALYRDGNEWAKPGSYYPNTVYAHLFTHNGEYIIQYWFFYPFNDFVNNHEGDWEHINVVITSQNPATAQINRVIYYFHHYYYVASTTQVENPTTFDCYVVDSTHPVVFVGGYGRVDSGCWSSGAGSGSHGSYPIFGTWPSISPEKDVEWNGIHICTVPAIDETVDGIGDYISYTNIVDTNLNDIDGVFIIKGREDYNYQQTPEMSWLGANIIWGYPYVKSMGTEHEFYSGQNVGNYAPCGPAFNEAWEVVDWNVGEADGLEGFARFYSLPNGYSHVSDADWTPSPILSYSPSELHCGAHGQGEPVTTTFEIWNLVRNSDLIYSISPSDSWFTINPTSGVSRGEHDVITVTISHPENMYGYYRGDILLSSNGGSGNIPLDIVIGDSPNLPDNPSPPSGTTDVLFYTYLSWTCDNPDGDTLFYDVYLEAEDESPDRLVSPDQQETIYFTEILEPGTTYYWKINVTNDQGITTEGSVWSFTTRNPPNTVFVNDNWNGPNNDGGHEWGYNAFNSIKDGVIVVAENGRVNVLNGEYNGGILIDKPMTVLGENWCETRVNGIDCDYVFKITAPNVMISTFRINYCSGNPYKSGILIEGLSNSDPIIIRHNIIEHCDNGIYIRGIEGVGIHDVVVVDCLIKWNTCGLKIWNSLDNSPASYNRNPKTHDIGWNDFDNNSVGIELRRTHSTLLRYNDFTGMRDSAIGILIVSGSEKNKVVYNTFQNMRQKGILTDYSTALNQIYRNIFVNSPAEDNGYNYWCPPMHPHDPEIIGGNYWWDYLNRYPNVDSDNDGFYDTWYEIPGVTHRYDYYPVINYSQFYTLSLKRFPFFQSWVDDNNAGMVLNTIISWCLWDEIVRPQGPLSLYDEFQLISEYSNGDSLLNADEMVTGLNSKLDYDTYGYWWGTMSFSTAEDVLKQICIWIDYYHSYTPNHNEGNPWHTPAAIPLWGEYNEWAIIHGIVTDKKPWNNQNTGFQMKGFWVNNPIYHDGYPLYDPSYGYENLFITAQEMDDGGYFSPIYVTNDRYYGEYVAILDPPRDLSPEQQIILDNINVTIMTPTNSFSDNEAAFIKTIKTSQNPLTHHFEAQADHLIIEAASLAVQDILTSNQDRAIEFAFCAAEIPLFVHDTNGRDYYLIPYSGNTTSFIVQIGVDQGELRSILVTESIDKFLQQYPDGSNLLHNNGSPFQPTILK
ncbi:MAG: right-handed parallel beta-helix repeat-containing protein [Methanobacteriota archaeon]